LGRSEFENAEVKLADELKQMSIGPNDKITWAAGESDARLVYYSGMQINPVFSPLELAARRRGRTEVSLAILKEGAERIAQRLHSKQKEYVIFDDVVELNWFQHTTKAQYREVVRICKDPNKPEHSLIVITNKWNTGQDQYQPRNIPTTSTTQESKESFPDNLFSSP
jgi:hypothetical protein